VDSGVYEQAVAYGGVAGAGANEPAALGADQTAQMGGCGDRAACRDHASLWLDKRRPWLLTESISI